MPSMIRLHGGSIVVLSITLSTLPGCQQYERQPLDLSSYRSALLDRAAPGLRSESGLPIAFSLDDGLSADEAEALAMLYNPGLRLARLDADVARATATHAGLWSDPVVGFDGAEILDSSAPFEWGLIANLTIPVSGRLAVEKDRAAAAHETTLRAIVDQEWQVRHRVREAWLRWATACESARLHGALTAELERILSVTDRLQDLGEIGRPEARVFTLARATSQSEQMRLDAAAAHRRAEILALIGLPPGTALTLDPALPAITPPPTSGDLEERLIASNTRLAQHRAAYHVAEESLRLEIRKQYPDITIGTGYGNEDDDRLLLGLSLPLPVLNANRGAIAEAEANRDRERAVAETTFETLTHELHRAVMTYEQARARRRLIEGDITALTTTQLDDLERLADIGEVNALLLKESLTTAFGARLNVLELRLEEQLAALHIHALLGPSEGGDA